MGLLLHLSIRHQKAVSETKKRPEGAEYSNFANRAVNRPYHSYVPVSRDEFDTGGSIRLESNYEDDRFLNLEKEDLPCIKRLLRTMVCAL
ncbi:hypothetical protein M1N46_03045 [Dehalococcoidia bacterium]|nr:hypothetical protein [Dehalococcoidia bacterium]